MTDTKKKRRRGKNPQPAPPPSAGSTFLQRINTNPLIAAILMGHSAETIPALGFAPRYGAPCHLLRACSTDLHALVSRVSRAVEAVRAKVEAVLSGRRIAKCFTALDEPLLRVTPGGPPGIRARCTTYLL